MNIQLKKPTLKLLRLCSGMKQSDVAEKLGTTIPTVAIWESGRGFPRVWHIPVLAKLFNTDEGEIIASIQRIPAIKNYTCPTCKNRDHDTAGTLSPLLVNKNPCTHFPLSSLLPLNKYLSFMIFPSFLETPNSS